MARRVFLTLAVLIGGTAVHAFPPEVERAANLVVSATETVPLACPTSVWSLVKASDVICGHTEMSEEVFESRTAMNHPMFLNTQPWERTEAGIARRFVVRTADGLYRLTVQRLSATPKDATEVNFVLEAQRMAEREATGTALPPQGGTLAPPPESVAPADCARWTLRDLRIGMPLAEALKAHPTLKPIACHEGMRIAPCAFAWPDETTLLADHVLADGDKPEAKIVSVTIAAETLDVTWDEIKAALVEKWGRPSESHTLPTQDGVFVDEVWREPDCDLKASVVGTAGAAGLVLVSVTSIGAEQEYEKRRKEEREAKARKLLD